MGQDFNRATYREVIAMVRERWWHRVMAVDVIVEDLGNILETDSLRPLVMD